MSTTKLLLNVNCDYPLVNVILLELPTKDCDFPLRCKIVIGFPGLDCFLTWFLRGVFKRKGSHCHEDEFSYNAAASVRSSNGILENWGFSHMFFLYIYSPTNHGLNDEVLGNHMVRFISQEDSGLGLRKWGSEPDMGEILTMLVPIVNQYTVATDGFSWWLDVLGIQKTWETQCVIPLQNPTSQWRMPGKVGIFIFVGGHIIYTCRIFYCRAMFDSMDGPAPFMNPSSGIPNHQSVVEKMPQADAS